jgi:hypothetical protein
MEVSSQLHAPVALPTEKEFPVSIRQEAGWTTEPIWTRCRRGKFPAPAGNRTPETPIVQPAASRYKNQIVIFPIRNETSMVCCSSLISTFKHEICVSVLQVAALVRNPKGKKSFRKRDALKSKLKDDRSQFRIVKRIVFIETKMHHTPICN